MTRWILGSLIVGVMALAGYLVIRPRVGRPVLTVSSFLPTDDPLSDEIARGVRLALETREGRGGGYRIQYLPCDRDASHLANEALSQEEDCPRDNSNSSYAHLGLRPDLILPGLGRKGLTAWPVEGGVLVPLRLDADGRRAAGAIRVLGKEEAAVVTCHTMAEAGVPPHFHSGGQADRAARAFLEEVRREVSLRVLPLSVRGRKEKRYEEICDQLRDVGSPFVYLDVRDPEKIVHPLRDEGFTGEFLIPSAAYAEGGWASLVDGCLTILAHLRPPPPDLARKLGSSHPHAWAGYRSCLRLLDTLDRTNARTSEETVRAFLAAVPYDPVLDPGAATVGVYRIRPGGFDRVAILP